MVGEPFEVGLFLCWCWSEPVADGKWTGVVRFARKSDYSRPDPAYFQRDIADQFDSDAAALQAARQFATRRAYADALEI